MATLESLLFEMERRVILFKSTTTMPDATQLGFNADPNTAISGDTPGQTLIYNCPMGTRYAQDDGTQWYKKTMPNTWATFGSTFNLLQKDGDLGYNNTPAFNLLTNGFFINNDFSDWTVLQVGGNLSRGTSTSYRSGFNLNYNAPIDGSYQIVKWITTNNKNLVIQYQGSKVDGVLPPFGASQAIATIIRQDTLAVIHTLTLDSNKKTESFIIPDGVTTIGISLTLNRMGIPCELSIGDISLIDVLGLFGKTYEINSLSGSLQELNIADPTLFTIVADEAEMLLLPTPYDRYVQRLDNNLVYWWNLNGSIWAQADAPVMRHFIEGGIAKHEIYIPQASALNTLSGLISNTDYELLQTLGDNEHEYEVFYRIDAGTSGTIPLPVHGAIVFDQYRDAKDGLILKFDTVSQKPIDEAARDNSGNIVNLSSLDALGNYTLDRTPNGYPISLVYQIRIQEKYKSEINNNSIINETNVLNAENIEYTDSRSLNANNVDKALDDIIYNYDSTKDPTGFIDQDNISYVYDPIARTITLTHVSGFIDYSFRGRSYALTSPWVSPPHLAGTTSYYLKSIDGINFVWTTLPWDFYDVQVAQARYAPSSAEYYAVREGHGCNLPYSVHKILHNNLGTTRVSGLDIDGASILVNPANTAVTNAGNRPTVNSGYISDEDLATFIPSTLDTGPYTILWFDASGNSQISHTNTDIYAYTTNQILYNPIGSGLVGFTNTNYINMWAFHVPVTSDARSQQYRTVWLVGQNQFTTTASAQAEDPRGLFWGNITGQLPEQVPYAVITFQYNTGINLGLGILGRCKIAVAPRYLVGNKQTLITGSPNLTTHGALSGRSDIDSHPSIALSVDPSLFSTLIATDQQAIEAEIDGILTKLLPTRPALLSSKTLALSTSYSATQTSTGTLNPIVTDDTTPLTATLTTTWDGRGLNPIDTSTLTSEVDAVVTGTKILDGTNPIGVFGDLNITAYDDPYLGQSGKEGFWKQFSAFINLLTPVNLTASHTIQMKNTKSGNTNIVTFWADDPAVSTISGESRTITSPTPRWISGVPTLSVGDSINENFTVNNAVRKHYNATNFARVTSPQGTTNVCTLSGIQTEGGAISFLNKALVLLTSVYSENIVVTMTGYNSKNVAGTPLAVNSNARIDTVSNEALRKISGTGDYPASGYGGAYDSSQSLLTYTDELQMLNGSYGYPSGNYSSNLPAGPNYTGLVNERWLCFQPQTFTNATGFTLTFTGTSGTWTGAGDNSTSGIKVFFQVGSSAWGNGNSAYSGVGNLTVNGQGMMVVGSSTYLVKRCTVGSTPLSGLLTVRIALPSGSNKRFTGITITAVS
jgi:hypothetical protein